MKLFFSLHSILLVFRNYQLSISLIANLWHILLYIYCSNTSVYIITHFYHCITFSFTNSCVSALISWAEVMFLRDNILTDKFISALLTACTFNNFMTEVLQILILMVCCSVIMIKKLCYWINCLFESKVIKAVRLN